MNRKLILFVCLAISALLVGASTVTAQFTSPDSPPAQAGTAFSYQGSLSEDDHPANGSYDFRFILYDAAEGGSQVGSTLEVADQVVSQGQFTAVLDFGRDPFNGAALWLEVAVRPGDSSGNYTVLSPRQALTAAPYALYALDTALLAGLPADAYAGADHDHLGESWLGSDNSLVLTGTFGAPYTATLVLGNTGGNALLIPHAANAGVKVTSAGAPAEVLPPDPAWPDYYQNNGFQVDGAEGFGLYVGSAGIDGMRISSTGDDGLQVSSAGGTGVEVGSAGGDGVNVDTAGDDGLQVSSAGDDGVYVSSAGGDGVYVSSAGGDGVYVSSAVENGFKIYSAGSAPAYYDSAFHNGVEINGAEGFGITVGETGSYGYHLHHARSNGLHVNQADNHGVYVWSAANYEGYFNGDIFVAGACAGCTIATFGVNVSGQTLQPGDVLALQGTLPALSEQAEPLLQVAPAGEGQPLAGVVAGRAELVQDQLLDPEVIIPVLVPRQGPAGPGEYVTVLIFGLAQVRVEANSAPDSGRRPGEHQRRRVGARHANR